MEERKLGGGRLENEGEDRVGEVSSSHPSTLPPFHSNPLYLHEEITLLALHNEKGTSTTSYPSHLIAGAVLAELLLSHHISVENTRKQSIQLQNTERTGEPIIDECLAKMRVAKKPLSLKNWVSKFANIKHLQHKVARQLCNREILRADESSVLFIFTRKVYPEINATPEQEIVERIRAAIFTDDTTLDPRTVVLVALANGAELLPKIFGRNEIRARKGRIQQIVNGEMIGKATKEVIQACQAAMMVAAIMPAMIATVNTSN